MIIDPKTITCLLCDKNNFSYRQVEDGYSLECRNCPSKTHFVSSFVLYTNENHMLDEIWIEFDDYSAGMNCCFGPSTVGNQISIGQNVIKEDIQYKHDYNYLFDKFKFYITFM